jgi:iron complex transport system permease protein
VSPSSPPGHKRVALVAALSAVALVVAFLGGLMIGYADVAPLDVVRSALSKVGIGHNPLSATYDAIVWQYRAPRVVLGLLVGSMLAVAGGAYQGVFRNPLADPYLLGVAAGAGLGATIAIAQLAHGASVPTYTPWLAFAGAIVAVVATWTVGGRAARTNTAVLVLAGVAISSLLTSAQTFLQQSSDKAIAQVYLWLLGSLAGATWSKVGLVTPYVLVCGIVLVAASRSLDVMSVGDVESRSLGLSTGRVRLVVVGAASLGTAAVVSVCGLIGFVGIIIPHLVRLAVGTSYRRILPISLALGAAFLVVCDTVARTVLSGGELPIGVVTALVGAPVFVIVLNVSRRPTS